MITPEYALVIMVGLIIKHFICDFPISIQTPWMFLNKGTYGHPGGLVHSFIHAHVSTVMLAWMWIIFRNFNVDLIIFLFPFEFLVHYHMDWFKVWYGKRKNWTPQTPEFWTFLGIDQMVHYLTYIVMIWWLI